MKQRLMNLSREIQKNPNAAQELIKNFETDSDVVFSFLNSIRNQVVYVLPALIEAFAYKYRDVEPGTLKELTESSAYLGAMFTDMDGVGYTYLGLSVNGKALCRPDNSVIIQEMSLDTQIKWIF